MGEKPRSYDPAAVNKFWIDEAFDKYLPSYPGYINDFVLSLRGTEIPTIYAIWTSLLTISATIKREAWLEWFPNKVFANIYVVLIGQPGVSHKSTAINFATKVLRNQIKHVQHPNFKHIKDLNILKDKASPEAILDQMIPSREGGGEFKLLDDNGRPILDHRNNPVVYENTSEITIVVSEMSSLMNMQTYTQSLVENLTSLYDPEDTYEWSTIKRDGKVILKNLYTCFLAGTTIASLRESIPKAARGDGFLTRTILVPLNDKNERRFHRPKAVPGGPGQEHLEKCLAWIGENIVEEYHLSKEADEYFEKYYNEFRDDLENNPETVGIYSRKALHVLKVSLLVSAARYNTTKEISVDDVKYAVSLINATVMMTPAILTEIDSDALHRKLKTIIEYIKAKKTVNRKSLMQNQHLMARELDLMLDHFVKEGCVKIFLDNFERRTPSGKMSEEYVYVETE